MNPMRAILSGFRHYANFEGRASRSEYWWFYGFFVVFLVAIFVAILVWTPTLLSVWVAYLVVMAPPLMSVTVRRLHDVDRSGRWAILGFLPFAGGPSLTRLLSRPGTVGPNRHGPDPLRPGLGGGWRQHPVRPAARPHEITGSEYPGSEYPGSEYPGSEYPGSEYPGSEYPGSEYPGSEYPGSEYPGSEYPGSEYPGSEYPGSEYPGSEYPGSEYPGSEYPGSEYPGSEYPGSEYPGSEYPGSE